MQGKVAVVTGAAGGIGEAIVRKLGDKGVKVVGTGRNAGKLQALKDKLGAGMEFAFVAASSNSTSRTTPRRFPSACSTGRPGCC